MDLVKLCPCIIDFTFPFSMKEVIIKTIIQYYALNSFGLLLIGFLKQFFLSLFIFICAASSVVQFYLPLLVLRGLTVQNLCSFCLPFFVSIYTIVYKILLDFLLCQCRFYDGELLLEGVFINYNGADTLFEVRFGTWSGYHKTIDRLVLLDQPNNVPFYQFTSTTYNSLGNLLN